MMAVFSGNVNQQLQEALAAINSGKARLESRIVGAGSESLGSEQNVLVSDDGTVFPDVIARKHIKSASYKDGQLQAYNKEGALVVNKTVEPNKLEEYVGKDLAETMVENAKKDEEIRKAYREAIKNNAPQSEIDRLQDAVNQSKTDYSGLDFQVGGEFHKMLYDKKIPDFVNKYGKKYGMKVGDVKLRYEKGRAPADYETQAAQN